MENERTNDNDRCVLAAHPGKSQGRPPKQPELEAHRPTRPAQPRSPQKPPSRTTDRTARPGQQPSTTQFHAPNLSSDRHEAREPAGCSFPPMRAPPPVRSSRRSGRFGASTRRGSADARFPRAEAGVYARAAGARAGRPTQRRPGVGADDRIPRMRASPPVRSSRPLGTLLRASRWPRSRERIGRGARVPVKGVATTALPGRKRASGQGPRALVRVGWWPPDARAATECQGASGSGRSPPPRRPWARP